MKCYHRITKSTVQQLKILKISTSSGNLTQNDVIHAKIPRVKSCQILVVCQVTSSPLIVSYRVVTRHSPNNVKPDTGELSGAVTLDILMAS